VADGARPGPAIAFEQAHRLGAAGGAQLTEAAQPGVDGRGFGPGAGDRRRLVDHRQHRERPGDATVAAIARQQIVAALEDRSRTSRCAGVSPPASAS
jgi:hypothetical protein